MTQCSNCYPTNLIYEIKAAGERNLLVLPQIIPFLSARGFLVKATENTMLVSEAGIADLDDFCQDHMNIEQLTFRLEDASWQPFGEIKVTLSSQWVDDIILQQRVICYAQPIVDAQGSVYAHEMLARFVQEDGSLLSPLAVFEAAKLRNRLYSLDRLCRMAAVRSSKGLSGKVFINFIPTSIYSPQHCLQSTIQLAQQLNIDPSKLVFEVVETEQVDDLDHLKSILGYYKHHGFQYALDDVGEGFSTIELLQQLKPHYMKLDKGFVQGVAISSEKQIVAIKMLEAAVQINSVPLAEGVEDEVDFAWLRDNGFKLFQGYLFGRPAPIA
ncbi:EAL domain-containing protein [Cohnella sp. WQ 127256]|uniref:EAL domain-containing protein n=1 Tax=Cohnella sp. WQ 127256 TaxID=2938790 RepID=UPI0021192CBD